jgi:hypothetical protein
LPCIDGVEHFLDHVVRDLGAASWMPSEALAKEGDTGDRR